MQGYWSMNLVWWITVVEIPSLAGLFWLVWRNRRDQEQALHETRQRLDAAMAQARESLAAYKLEVAKSYVSMAYMKDVERRLTGHLLRIEAKLEPQIPERSGQ